MTWVVSREDYASANNRLRQKLKDSRVEVGMTQAQAARFLGKPQSFVSKLETSGRRVEFLEVQVLAEVYGKPLTHYLDLNLSPAREGESDQD